MGTNARMDDNASTAKLGYILERRRLPSTNLLFSTVVLKALFYGTLWPFGCYRMLKNRRAVLQMTANDLLYCEYTYLRFLDEINQFYILMSSLWRILF